MKLPDVKTAEVSGKRVFLRADLDVPLSNGLVEDDARLVAGFPTIGYLLKNGARVIVAGHLDRPKGKDPKFSLGPVAKWLANHFNDIYHLSEERLDGFPAWQINANLFLLENLRFYKDEEENNLEFAKKLASLADVYVNDAFAMCHRSHASVVGVAKILPHFAGLRLQKEVEVLSQVLKNPQRPLVVVIGGKKVETKLPLVLKMVSLADQVLVGGKIAQELKEIHPKLTVATSNTEGNDISEESVQQFKTIIKTAKTIVWNGPVGKIESVGASSSLATKLTPFSRSNMWSSRSSKAPPSELGTKKIAGAIVESSAYKVVGGGDTTEFLKRIGLLDKFDFVSTGGGAMLAFLSGEKLPGLEVLLR